MTFSETMTDEHNTVTDGGSIEQEKSFEDVFVENGEFQESKLKGAVIKYVEYKTDDSHIVDMRIPYQEKGNRVKQAFYDFESWVSRRVTGYYEYTTNNDEDRDYMMKLFVEMYDDNDRVERYVHNYTEKYVEGEGFVDLEDEQMDGKKEDNMKHHYEKLNEAGLVSDDYTIQDGKMLGAMLQFAKEVEAIEAPTEEVDIKEFISSWNKWMLEKFGTEWIQMLSNEIDPGMLKGWGETLLIKSDDIEEILEDKWVYKEDELEGNSDDGEIELNKKEDYDTIESVPQSPNNEEDDDSDEINGKATLSDF